MVRKRKESRVCWSSRWLPFKPSRAFLCPPDHNPDSSPGSGGPPSFGPAYVISGSTSCRAPWPSPQPPTYPARIAAPCSSPTCHFFPLRGCYPDLCRAACFSLSSSSEKPCLGHQSKGGLHPHLAAHGPGVQQPLAHWQPCFQKCN